MGRHFTARLRQMPVPLRSWLCACLLVFTALPTLPALAAGSKTSRDGTLTATMAGEFALQAGKLDDAARWYLDAARASSGDAGLAERATRIALLADDGARATEALSLWRQRAPGSLAMQAADATLSLRRNDAATARLCYSIPRRY